MIKKKSEIDFSIVTIVNKLNVFDDFCKSLETQSGVSFELIPIYNLKGEYKSARSAFNSTLNRCTGKYVIFTHPDIRFETSKELSATKTYLNEIANFGVIGAAGAVAGKYNKNKRVIYSNMVHGINKKRAGVKIDSLKEVQTVDECFFVLDKKYIIKNKFSKLDGWHLYAVELCLRCILDNKKNYVIPLNIWHLSDGKSLNSNYIHQLNRIIQIYSDKFPVLYTTVKIWKTKGLRAKIYRHYYFIKQEIKGKILRCE